MPPSASVLLARERSADGRPRTRAAIVLGALVAALGGASGACAQRTGAADGAGVLPTSTAPGASPATSRARQGSGPGAPSASASAAPTGGELAPPPPPLSPELRAACALSSGERPLRSQSSTTAGSSGQERSELLLTDRRLCGRIVDAAGQSRDLSVPLHRIIRTRLVSGPSAGVALVIHDVDFLTQSLPFAAPGEESHAFLVALESAWRAARTAFTPPPLPPKPFELALVAPGPRRPDGPGRPRFDHACKLARAGQLDAALAWLEEAAVTEGVGVKRADAESSLAALRRDPRWPTLRAFLVAAAEHWAFAPLHRDPLVLPTKTAGASRPVALYMHGIYSHGEVGAREQRLADELGIAIIAVDATLPSGQGRFRWTETADLDLARLDAALARHRAELGSEGRLLLYGFSQGAMAAGVVAFQSPDRFAGVLLMSPGSATDATFDELAATPAHTRLVLRCDAAAGEAASTVKMTRRLCATGQRLGAATTLRIVADATEHRLPEDFPAVFRAWSRQSLAQPAR